MAEITKPSMVNLWASGGAIIAPSASKVAIGWTAEIPPHQWENYVQNRQDRAIAYLYQSGIAEWDSTTEYFTNRSVVLYSGKIYIAQTGNTNSQPDVNPSDWISLEDSLIAASSPAGMVSAYAGATAPAGFLFCQGQAVSRATYARLFAAIGTTYGTGNGSTTFNLPDLRGEFIRGFDAGRGIDSGRVLGSSQTHLTASHTHTASSATAGSHTHGVSTDSAGNHTHNGNTTSNGAFNHTGYVAGEDGLPDTGITLGPVTGGLADMSPFLTSVPNHSHNFTTNAEGTHNHTVNINSAGDHTHTVTVNPTGGTETRPRNVAMNYIIKT